MIRVISIILILAVVLALEIFLSLKKSKWLGLIIPAVLLVATGIFLLFNLSAAFADIRGFGEFLQSYGGTGVWALTLKIGFALSPTIISLIAYFVCRAVYKGSHPNAESKEMKKMMANDIG